ncbi:YeeE/YedE family protein, partial [Mesorhizobium sp. M2A.F.Ca.ET.046.02.1.1]
LVVGGFLVGVGVHFGGGCPSGHGICGIARLSPRSFVAVATFMATAFVTVFVTRHVIGG